VAPSLGDAAMRAALPPGLDVRLLRGIDTDLIQAADAALVTSGTATLELALLGLPMVVAYRGTRAMWMQYLLHRRFFAREARHIALPNILADADIVPELLQDQATPATLADAVGPLLADTPARRAQTDAFKAITTSLGEPGAVERTARMVLDAVRVRPGG
jgi:lipid-A-disaccharide synthase